MLRIKIDGRIKSGDDLESIFLHEAFARVSQELRERFGSIRHPETGEFVFLTVHGHSLSDMRISLEASTALLDVVKSRLPDDEPYPMTFSPNDRRGVPKVFLSFGSADKEMARRIATQLMASGIDTWWSEWEIGAGDSIRQKVDEGLGTCTNFLVLLTPNSIKRDWVNTEIDAGFLRKISQRSRFIGLRHGVEPYDLSPLLATAHCPAVSDGLDELPQIINDIHGLTRKPALGEPPAAVLTPSTGFSAAATLIAEVYCRSSEYGEGSGHSYDVNQLAEYTKLSVEDVTDALYELRAFFREHHGDFDATPKLFAEFDRHFHSWNPEEDALKIACDLMNYEKFPSQPAEIAAKYGWSPRQLNPAMFYLKDRGVIDVFEYCGTTPFLYGFIEKTDATRRYVKSRS